MPRPYLLAICSASALDARSNNFSLFVLVEQLQIQQAPVDLPLEIHVYYEFDEPELGVPHEMRLELVDVNGNLAWHSPWIALTSPSRRHRLALAGIQIPNLGYFHLFATIRTIGQPADDAQRSPWGWPLEVTQAEPAQQPG